MNRIKKMTALAVICLLTVSAFAKKAGKGKKIPEFENGRAYVFSAEGIGKYKDNIRFVNHSEEDNLVYRVYMYNEKTETWFLFGTAKLKDFGDTDIVRELNEKAKIKEYRFFAIVLSNGDAGDFDYDLTVEHDDLYIYVENK